MRSELVFADHLNAVTLKSTNIIALTALMNMYTVLVHGAGHVESRRKLLSTALEIIAISDTFFDDDFNYLNTPVWVSTRT